VSPRAARRFVFTDHGLRTDQGVRKDMPRTSSAFKRHRQSEKNRTRNRANKNVLKKELKSFEKDLRANPADAPKLLAQVSGALDRAARKNAIPKGRADRKKSRLALLAQRLQKETASAKS